MPGWAGSSWYFLRYMDPNDDEVFVKRFVRLLGTGRFIYWRKRTRNWSLIVFPFLEYVLKDRGYINQDEPFQKLINQGMILGMSAFVYLELMERINMFL
jgi:leucyl-tRNA synthetase